MFGCFSLFQTLINTSRTISSCFIQSTDEEDGNGGKRGKAAQHASNGGGCCESLILLFLFAWLITGSVWVFGFYRQFISMPPQCQADVTLAGCCAAVPYWFSFGSIIAIYALSVLSCIVFCTCFCCCACIFGIVGAASSDA